MQFGPDLTCAGASWDEVGQMDQLDQLANGPVGQMDHVHLAIVHLVLQLASNR
jgi:hypothetical protein